MKGRADDAGPDDPVYAPSELVERLLMMVEDAGIPGEIWEPFVRAVERWEAGQEPPLNRLALMRLPTLPPTDDRADAGRRAYLDGEAGTAPTWE